MTIGTISSALEREGAMTKGEPHRLDEDAGRLKNWKRWGPFLSERQWAIVRVDYSPDGKLWESVTRHQVWPRIATHGLATRLSLGWLRLRADMAKHSPMGYPSW